MERRSYSLALNRLATLHTLSYAFSAQWWAAESVIRYFLSVIRERGRAWALMSGFALALALTGCVTKAKADAQARAAFLAGQQQATQRLQQPLGPKVVFIGPVDNPSVPWTSELTLAKAFVSAGYHGPDPTEIIVVHNGQATHVDPNKLLNGEDVPLAAGDIVSVK